MTNRFDVDQAVDQAFDIPLVGRHCDQAQPLRVGVMCSGSGSNLAALLAARRPEWMVSVVVANVPGVRALERAASAGVPGICVPHKVGDVTLARPEHEARIQAVLEAHDVELVVLAGYMRVVTSTFTDAWASRLINVHPALLPAFPGMHGARQALDHGCRVAGCTVHLVDAGVDTGPILAQAAVPIFDDDDEATLQARIQVQEHRLLPAVVGAWAAGRVVRRGTAVRALGLVGNAGSS